MYDLSAAEFLASLLGMSITACRIILVTILHQQLQSVNFFTFLYYCSKIIARNSVQSLHLYVCMTYGIWPRFTHPILLHTYVPKHSLSRICELSMQMLTDTWLWLPSHPPVKMCTCLGCVDLAECIVMIFYVNVIKCLTSNPLLSFRRKEAFIGRRHWWFLWVHQRQEDPSRGYSRIRLFWSRVYRWVHKVSWQYNLVLMLLLYWCVSLCWLTDVQRCSVVEKLTGMRETFPVPTR